MGFRRALSRRRRSWRGVRFRDAGGEHLVGESGEFGGAPALLAGRCWPDAGTCFEGRGTGWYEAGARRESPPGGNWLGPSRGWDGGRLPRAAGWRTQLLRGLSVREVSFGGVWPSSRIRYDEGGRSGRFRLGRLGRSGLGRSRRDEGRCDGPFVDGRQDAGPDFRPVDVVMVRRRVLPQPSRPGPATRGSPGPAGGRGPT